VVSFIAKVFPAECNTVTSGLILIVLRQASFCNCKPTGKAVWSRWYTPGLAQFLRLIYTRWDWRSLHLTNELCVWTDYKLICFLITLLKAGLSTFRRFNHRRPLLQTASDAMTNFSNFRKHALVIKC